MQKTFLSVVIVLSIVFVFSSAFHNEATLGVNYASAEEIPTLSSTTTLVAASSDAWNIPATTTQQETPKTAKKFLADTPVRLIIPSISLDTPIVGVGLNAKGEMAVPSGSTDNVGWYKNGIMPGEIGSTVLDAHVFAAFDHLDELKDGSDIIIETENGERLRFVVERTQVYKLSDITSSMLFGKTDERRLNLITCAGQLTPDHSTYTQRLVVYAVFAEVL